MRITRIEICGLFGRFDHRIPLFPSDPITIIHGTNGVGKTSVLRLIYGALRPDYSHLRQIPFSSIEIHFDDSRSLAITPAVMSSVPSRSREDRRRRRPKASRPLDFKLRGTDGGGLEEFSYVGGESSALLRSRLDDHLPFLHQTGPSVWYDDTHEDNLNFQDVVDRYGDILPEEYGAIGSPPWLQEIQEATPIHFIETQRLLDVPQARKHRRSSGAPRLSAVQSCSDDCARFLGSKLEESAALSQSLERTFPVRVITGTGPSSLSEVQIREELSMIDAHRGRLAAAGLLDPGFEPPLPTQQFDETTKRVLTVFVQDTKKKLAVFDGLLARIELMISIVNSRFLNKTLEVNRTEGFTLLSGEDRSIQLSHLSSGEQHELVLLFELLFRAPKSTFILIDEPELSLHIAWQQQFLRDLIDIARLVDLQALVATHSPQIIHDRWDLTVELTGPAK